MGGTKNQIGLNKLEHKYRGPFEMKTSIDCIEWIDSCNSYLRRHRLQLGLSFLTLSNHGDICSNKYIAHRKFLVYLHM